MQIRKMIQLSRLVAHKVADLRIPTPVPTATVTRRRRLLSRPY